MEQVLGFFREYELWVYLILGFGGLLHIRKFILAWQELRLASFGLEKESAQFRLNRAASMLVLLFTMALIEFSLVTFIIPSVPGAIPLLTPTLNLLVTPTITLLPTTASIVQGILLPATQTVTPGAPLFIGNGCVLGQLLISSPQEGAQISGIVEIMGTVDIPNFGFYKLEMKRPEEPNWLTILAGNEVKRDTTLGAWNTSLLPPANYLLSLVAVDNQGKSSPPCIIQITITSTPQTP